MKKVLITGANSYIGEAVKQYLENVETEEYIVDVMDTLGLKANAEMFADYDVVFNVAGIAHIKENNDNRQLYYDVNRDMVINIAKLAKQAGVRHFILLSSMSVYGMTTGHIEKNTYANPINAYGESKLQADEQISVLGSDDFKVAILRPPMVYGNGCKGNYQSLRKFAMKSPVFPNVKNERSMIFIGNLCEFVKKVIDNEQQGIFFPQNAEYVNTSAMVKGIAKLNGKKLCLIKGANFILKRVKIGVFKKVFGSLTYEKTDVVNKYSFQESMKLTEGKN